jgi:phosphate/sulfate permease
MKKILKRFSFPVTLWLQKDERSFLSFVIFSFLLAMFVTPYPQIAMWVGFLFAAYAAVANDSIQTLGTFIASNQNKKWWVLWIFIGGIFLATVGYSFLNYNGDVSHGRLMAKGFEVAPTNFHFLQIAAPIFLLILTRLRMPVSTTFILLTSFAAAPAAIGKVLAKSMSGYILAFFSRFLCILGYFKIG